jgi:hypothetical protein
MSSALLKQVLLTVEQLSLWQWCCTHARALQWTSTQTLRHAAMLGRTALEGQASWRTSSDVVHKRKAQYVL